MAGGQRLEHLEVRRNDEVYLDALGAERIPDPTAAGDFCRRFGEGDVERLMDIFNETRLRAWKQQPDDFFDEAFLDADGRLTEGGTEEAGLEEFVEMRRPFSWSTATRRSMESTSSETAA